MKALILALVSAIILSCPTPMHDTAMASSSRGVMELTATTFNQETSHGTILVDFYTTWCPTCKALEPELKEAARTHPEYRFGKLDIDRYSDIGHQYSVAVIPTMVVFVDGKEIKRHVGYLTAPEIVKWIEE